MNGNLGKREFIKGAKDGMPICIGYLSVAFAFGIFATGLGLSVWEAVFISMFNVTSAGQLAGAPIVAARGSVIELALTQLVINARYSLMSVSLSQKMDRTVTLKDRFAIAFVNTDEVFAVASGRDGMVGRAYLYGLILPSFFGWTLGTLIGAVCGNILPAIIISALGIAIYAMFIAIIVPAVKTNLKTAFAVLSAIVLSCLFKYLPVLNTVPSGFVIIICAVSVSALFALIAPIPDEKEAADGE